VTKPWKSICPPSSRSPIGAIPVEKLFPEGETSRTVVRPERFQPVTPPQCQPGPTNPRWKLPPSEWPTIVERTDRGESLLQIAKEYGVSYPVVRKAEKLARLGMNLPPRPRPSQWKIPEAEWPAVLQQIEQGCSLSQIGREYGVSRKAVRRVVHAARERLQVPEPPDVPSSPGHIAPAEWTSVLARIDQGETHEHIASEYGVAEVTIRRVEKRARKALGAEERPRYRHWSIQPSEWPTIVARIDQGVSQRQLAKEYGVSPSTIKVVNRTARLRHLPPPSSTP
jgi:transposase